MTKLILGVVLVGVIGCGTDDGSSAASCQQAMEHFYASGCTFFDPSTTPPTPTSENAALNACEQINGEVPLNNHCRPLFDDFKACLVSTPAHATTSDCDCSQEKDTLFACSP